MTLKIARSMGDQPKGAHEAYLPPAHLGTGASLLSETGSSWSAEVTALGVIRMRREGLARFRRHPSPIPEGWTVPQPSRLRHSDDQTLAALAAVYGAVASDSPPDPGRFRDWGVVAASRFMGRGLVVNVLERFGREGAWGVTPHITPHYTLHAQSGTLSQVLGLHGPNLGVGGGVGAAIQGFVTALTWLTGATVPGVWLVLSGWSPEYVPDEAGGPVGDPECLGIALALVPPEAGRGDLPRIRVRPISACQTSGEVDLVDLAGRLTAHVMRKDTSREETANRDARVRVGSATLRLDPGHVAGGSPVVVAQGCGIQIELERAGISMRRRLG